MMRFFAALVVLCAAAVSVFAESTKPLNLLIVTADDMNADSVGWMGNTLGATPHLDAFAKTAYRFVNCHVTVPICQPGRSALMTGLVPHNNGALGFNPIRRDVPTLVETLRDQGYYTATIAKAKHMTPPEKFPWHAIGEQELGKRPTQFANKFREMMQAAAQNNKPFFINANICDPHRPFIRGGGNKPGDEPLEGARVYLPHEVTVPSFLEDLPPVRAEVAQYYSNVSRFDVAFGLVMKELAAAGRAADTVVVFLSDHGMSFPFAKATVYYNGTCSPTLIRVPGMQRPQTKTEFVSSIDIMPTVLELLNVQPKARMDGRSWVPLLKGEQQLDRDFVITHVNTISGGKSFAQRCIRTKDRALMFHDWVGGPDKFRVEAMSGLSFAAMNASTDPKIQSRVKQLVEGEPLMLFDTAADPGERKNLIDDHNYSGDVDKLSKQLLAHMRQTNDPQLAALEAALSRQAVAEIKRMLNQAAIDWTANNLDGFMASYANSPTLRFAHPKGITLGFDTVKERYAKSITKSDLKFSDLDVTVLALDAAVAFGRFHNRGKDGTNATGLFTLLVRKIEGRWKITHDHSSDLPPDYPQ